MRSRLTLLILALLAAPCGSLLAQTRTAPDTTVMGEASVTERPVIVPGSCLAPTYPILMRDAKIEGRVLLQFVVDTLGRIEPASVVTIQSTHSQFEAAARRALLTCRYRPGRAGPRAVRVKVQMPFSFRLST